MDLENLKPYGIKRPRINMAANEITIAHTVVATTVNNKRILVKKDIPKNNSSYRTLPMIPTIKEFLLNIEQKQDKNRKLFGKNYKNTDNYVCVDSEGVLIHPDALTRKFKKFLKDNNLKKIRLHDLRHSVGSLLIKNASTREVQEWLGHSNVSTTEIYTHLDSSSKQNSANIIANIIGNVA